MLKRKDLIKGDVFSYIKNPEDTFFVDDMVPGQPSTKNGKSIPEGCEEELVYLVWRDPNAKTIPQAASGPVQPAEPTVQPTSPSAVLAKSTDTKGTHYTKLNPEPIDAIEGWGLNFRLANVIKYVARHGRKPGSDASADLRKALRYLKREIASLEGHRSWECSA